ncbi:MAG: phosphate signaling complex protein PhoU [Bdellovibrionales bacterium]
MERAHTTQLESLRTKASQMGQYTQKALGLVMQALAEKRLELFDEVFEIEKKINDWHKQVDEDAVEYLAQNGPVARDLRAVIALVKINTDLERMGDQCVNMAYIGKDALKRRDDLNVPVIRTMFSIVQEMIQKSLESFINHDSKVAESVLVMDDEVDALKVKVQKDMLEEMKKTPDLAEKFLALILIARNLERFGDHATNIAEDVIYAEAGQDIRHGGFS